MTTGHRISADDRREQLLRAAIAVIARDGVGKASTRRIAEEAGMPQPALHYCYRGKEELFIEVLDAGATRFRELVADISPHAGLPQTTEWLMSEIFDWFVDEPDMFGALFELLIWSWHLSDNRAQSKDVYDTYIGLAAEVLRRGLRPGEDVDVTGLARYLIAALDGVYLQYETYHDLDRARQMYQQFIKSAVALASEYELEAPASIA